MVTVQVRQALAYVLAVMATLQIVGLLLVAFVGPFQWYLGPVRVSAADVYWPSFTAALFGAAAMCLYASATRAPRLRVWAERAALVAVPASMVALVWPLLGADFAFGHDIRPHATYAYLFDRALRQGQVPVRWVETISYGQGQPLFNHYQVGLYYLVSFVHYVVPSLSLSLKLVVAALWYAGPLFMFLLFRPLGRLPAAAAAAMLAWAPYLLLNNYVRAAFPELLAVSLAPAVLWAIDRFLRTGGPLYLSALALAVGAILLSHLPTVLITLPMFAAYGASRLLSRQATVTRAAALLPAAAIGAGLAAFYVWPALAELGQIRIALLTGSYFDYHDHFVHPVQWVDYRWGYGPSMRGPGDDMSLQIGVLQWVAIAGAAAAVLSVVTKRRAWSQTGELACWLCVALLSMFMMTEPSTVVWDFVRPLSFVQFPWRLLLLVAIACAAMTALLVSLIRSRTVQAAVVIAVVTTQWYVTRDYRKAAYDRPRMAIAIDTEDWRDTDMAFREPGYDPVSAATQDSVAEGRWAIAAGAGNVTVRRMADDELDLDVNSDERSGMQLVVNSPYVLGWILWLDGVKTDFTVRPSDGYLVVDVPPGHHRVEARFLDTPTRARANRATVVSALLWVVSLAVFWRRSRHTGTTAPPRASSP